MDRPQLEGYVKHAYNIIVNSKIVKKSDQLRVKKNWFKELIKSFLCNVVHFPQGIDWIRAVKTALSTLRSLIGLLILKIMCAVFGRPGDHLLLSRRLINLGNYNEAERNLKQALNISKNDLEKDLILEKRLISDLLVECYFRSHMYFDAIDQLFYSKLIAMGLSNAESPVPALLARSGKFRRKTDIHRHAFFFDCASVIYERVINDFNDFEGAALVGIEMNAIRNCILTNFEEVDATTLILPSDWTRNIGHLCLLDFLVKVRHAGWRNWSKIMLLAPSDQIANKQYLELWKKYVTVVSEPAEIEELTPIASIVGERVAHMFDVPGSGMIYFCECLGHIQEGWKELGKPALLELPSDIRKSGWSALQRLGVPAGAWFVAIHTRDSGYHCEFDNDHQAHRNADINDYLPAIEAITDRGGWVIRMGDSSMKRLPFMKQVVDYAHTKEKSELMDVFLAASCKFFMGVTSGLVHMPFTFGVPCLISNWCSNAYPPKNSLDLFIPKLLLCKASNVFFDFQSMFRASTRNLCYSMPALKLRGLVPVNNTPEDIHELVLEMLDRVAGISDDDSCNDSRQDQFRQIATSEGIVGCPDIGRKFLERYQHLLRSDSNDYLRESA